MKKIYIEYNKENFKKVIELISQNNKCNNNISLKIIFFEKNNLSKIFSYLKKYKFSKIYFVINNLNFNNQIIKILNDKKSNVSIQLIINKELDEKNKVFFTNLIKINQSIDIFDYQKYLNISASNNLNIFTNKDKKEENKMLYVYCNNGNINCKTSSCLGKILYIDKFGNISFCPKYPKDTYLNNISNISNFDNIYENDIFGEYLKKMILKRKNCKSSCEYFSKCKGGCAIEDNCESFKNLYLKTKNNIESILKNQINLETLPLSIKENILWMICSDKGGSK